YSLAVADIVAPTAGDLRHRRSTCRQEQESGRRLLVIGPDARITVPQDRAVDSLLQGPDAGPVCADSAELTAQEIPTLLEQAPFKAFVYAADEIFGKADTAQLKNEKSLRPMGEFLETTPFGLAVVTAYTGLEGEKDKNLTLTRARASVVREYLAKKFRLDD